MLGTTETEYGFLPTRTQSRQKTRTQTKQTKDTSVKYPTPTASDIEGGTAPDVQMKNGHFYRENKKGERWGVKLRDAVSIKRKPGGRLNPEFVEFLMGYPMGWTEIEPKE